MQIKIIGDTVQFVSSIKAEEFELLRTFNKKVTLLDKEKNEKYVIELREGSKANINSYGTVYSSITSDGFAMGSMICAGYKKEEIVKLLTTDYAQAIATAQECENAAAELVEEVKAMQATVSAVIEVEE